MARLVCAAAALAATVRADPTPTPTFEEYLGHFRLSFEGSELGLRKQLFDRAVAEVEAQNARPGRLWQAALNEHSVKTAAERRQMLAGFRRDPDEHYAEEGAPGTEGEAEGRSLRDREPEHLDWRDRHPNVVTPVKRQGLCASCWAHASAAAIETAVAIHTGVLMELSVQQLVSCTPNKHRCGGDGGCWGGTADLAFAHATEHGMSSLWSYPYRSHVEADERECLPLRDSRRPVAGITGFVHLTRNDERAMVRALMKNPVTITVDSSPFVHYERGIFDECRDNYHLDHIVLMMGFGKHEGTHYWLVRNSWGAEWGEDGYIRFLRRPKEEECGWDWDPRWGYSCMDDMPKRVRACGACGLLSDSAYPVGGHLL